MIKLTKNGLPEEIEHFGKQFGIFQVSIFLLIENSSFRTMFTNKI